MGADGPGRGDTHARTVRGVTDNLGSIGADLTCFVHRRRSSKRERRRRLKDPVPGRVMPRDIDMGICPHVVKRRRALVLEDIRDFPRFAGNPVVDAIGVHSYLGAPLMDSTGVVLGTICVVDQDPHPWGHTGLETIKAMAAELVERIEESARRRN
ncbi:GAF domain-containing protein [Streptomyces sp. NPDC003233]